MNGGDSVSWAKKPAIPLDRKRAVYKKTVNQSSSLKKTCQKCALQGIHSPFHLFQLNDEEALWMCKNVDCTFMPSSNWESLVVKRSISEIPTLSSKKKSGSSSSSSSTSSAKSVASAPLLRLKSDVLPLSRSSSPALRQHNHGEYSHSQLLSNVNSETSVSVSSSRKSIDSPFISSVESEPAEREHKTFVPVAPFLCGHAHTFASFETKRIEDRRLERNQQSSARRNQSSFINKLLPTLTSEIEERNSRSSLSDACSLKRRGSSLDSDSLSSSSGSSRASSPLGASDFVKEKKVRKIIVTQQTLSKIVSGDLKVRLAKGAKSRNSRIGSSLGAVKKQTQSPFSSESVVGEHSSQQTTFGDCPQEQEQSLSSSSVIKPSLNIEVTPVGLLDSVQKNQSGVENSSPLQTLTIPGSQVDLQAHLQAINSHIEAINAALANSSSPLVIKPAEISNTVVEPTSAASGNVIGKTDKIDPTESNCKEK